MDLIMDFRQTKIGYGKKIDKFEEDNDETIVISTEHQGLKTKLKDNKKF